MYYIAATITALIAVGAWIGSTVPFIRENGEHADAQYMGWVIGIFAHLYFALAIAFSYKRRLPIGVYAHGLALFATGAFLILAKSVDT